MTKTTAEYFSNYEKLGSKTWYFLIIPFALINPAFRECVKVGTSRISSKTDGLSIHDCWMIYNSLLTLDMTGSLAAKGKNNIAFTWWWYHKKNLYECDTFYPHFISLKVNFILLCAIKTFINFKQIFSVFSFCFLMEFIVWWVGRTMWKSFTLLPLSVMQVMENFYW